MINHSLRLMHFLLFCLPFFPERKEAKDKADREMLAAWETQLVVGSPCACVSISSLMLVLEDETPTPELCQTYRISTVSVWMSHCPADISTWRKVKCCSAPWLTLCNKIKKKKKKSDTFLNVWYSNYIFFLSRHPSSLSEQCDDCRATKSRSCLARMIPFSPEGGAVCQGKIRCVQPRWKQVLTGHFHPNSRECCTWQEVKSPCFCYVGDVWTSGPMCYLQSSTKWALGLQLACTMKP